MRLVEIVGPLELVGLGVGSVCSGRRHLRVSRVWGARRCRRLGGGLSGEDSEEDRSQTTKSVICENTRDYHNINTKHPTAIRLQLTY